MSIKELFLTPTQGIILLFRVPTYNRRSSPFANQKRFSMDSQRSLSFHRVEAVTAANYTTVRHARRVTTGG
jgi:hypothetical protein